jgi:hypothetical protein
VRESLYWPDGTRRNCLEQPDENHDEIHLLVEALVDQYTEDHNLLEVALSPPAITPMISFRQPGLCYVLLCYSCNGCRSDPFSVF